MLEWRNEHFCLYARAELVARRIHIVFQYLHLDVPQVFVAQTLQKIYGSLRPVSVLLEEREDGAPVASCSSEQLVYLFCYLYFFLIRPESVLVSLANRVFFRKPSLVAGILFIANSR